jgi:hypothetical protein
MKKSRKTRLSLKKKSNDNKKIFSNKPETIINFVNEN